MMYLSYMNEHIRDIPPEDREVLAVVLDDEVFDNLRWIRSMCQGLEFPYETCYKFQFPNDKARLLEAWSVNELLTDDKEYQSWELGGDDPLDYYRFHVHPYLPKEEFWDELQPDNVMLHYFSGNSFGFDARWRTDMYYGYEVDLGKYL